jgi:hypothetical protein
MTWSQHIFDKHMFDKLKRLFQGQSPPVAETISDPVLGTLTWSIEDEAWLSATEYYGMGFVFQISGTPRPDGSLIRHAADIFTKREEFVQTVQQFLSEQTSSDRHFRAFKEEISGLKIERVCLFWPNRPDDGMIFFDGGLNHRVWRCDYVARTPKGLGFDS